MGKWGNEDEGERKKKKCLWTGTHPYMGMWEEEVAGDLGDGNEGQEGAPLAALVVGLEAGTQVLGCCSNAYLSLFLSLRFTLFFTLGLGVWRGEGEEKELSI